MADGKRLLVDMLKTRLGLTALGSWLSRTIHCHLECLPPRASHGVCLKRSHEESYADQTRQNRYGGVSIPSRLDSTPPSSAPGVTIIRPLCGLDNNLYHTLEAAMKLSYPKFEVIFALQDDQDEALPVVRMIMEKYPGVNARVIIGESKLEAKGSAKV